VFTTSNLRGSLGDCANLKTANGHRSDGFPARIAAEPLESAGCHIRRSRQHQRISQLDNPTHAVCVDDCRMDYGQPRALGSTPDHHVLASCGSCHVDSTRGSNAGDVAARRRRADAATPVGCRPWVDTRRRRRRSQGSKRCIGTLLLGKPFGWVVPRVHGRECSFSPSALLARWTLIPAGIFGLPSRRQSGPSKRVRVCSVESHGLTGLRPWLFLCQRASSGSVGTATPFRILTGDAVPPKGLI
jgi:hypothetical protein